MLRRVILLLILFFGQPIMANICPYVSQNSEIKGLASTTEATLESLENTVKECGEQFVKSIKAVRDLPSLLESAYTPLKKLERKRAYLKAEYAKAIHRGDEDFVLDAWLTDLDQVDAEIKQARKDYAIRDDKKGEQEALTAVSNLFDTLNNQVRNSKSDCAKHIGKSFAANSVSMGLGIVSLAAPTLSAGSLATGTIGSVAGLLSKIANFRENLPSQALTVFKREMHTNDIACMYHEIVMKSCEVEEISAYNEELKKKKKKNPRYNPVNEYIKGVRARIKGTEEYDKILGALEASNARVALKALGGMLDEGAFSLGGTNSLLDFSSFKTEEPTEKEKLNQKLQQYYAMKKLFIDGGINDSSLGLKDKSNSKYYLKQFMTGGGYSSIGSQMKSVGFDYTSTDENGNELSYEKQFELNNDNIVKYLNAKIRENGGDSSAGSGAKAFNYYSWGPVANELSAIRRANMAIKDIVLEKVKTDSTGDWSRTLPLIEESNAFIDELAKWPDLDPKKLEANDFIDSINVIGQQVRLKLGVNSKASVSTIQKKAEALLFAPYEKFNKNAKTKSKSKKYSGLSGLGVDAPETSDWDEYKSIFDVTQLTVTKPITTADRSLAAHVRDIFEADDSYLRSDFLDGIQLRMKNAASLTSSPEAIAATIPGLCELSVSLIRGTNKIVAPGCEKKLSPEFMSFYKKDERPSCAYYRYHSALNRSKYKSIDMPHSNQTIEPASRKSKKSRRQNHSRDNDPNGVHSR